MKTKPHTYEGERISVSFDLTRCIHAGECVKGLPKVFDPNRKPWVEPNQAEPEEILAVVGRCPTGALHAALNDGAATETTPERNAVTVAADGPLYFRGEIEVRASDGSSMLKDTRVALCRCGATKNQPFCDGSHAVAGFRDAGDLGQLSSQAESRPGGLRVGQAKNGPLLAEGPLDVRAAGGGEPVRCGKTALCRCGASQNKPFCDGSHKGIGFSAE